LTKINEENFLAAKALLDQISAGIKLFHLTEETNEKWHIAIGSGTTGYLAVAAADGVPSLSVRLATQPVVYNSNPDVSQSVCGSIQKIIEKGKPITVEYLKAPQSDSYKVVNIEDGQRGITYKKLFGGYLVDALRVKIVAPYIRMPHQVQNLQNLLSLIPADGSCNVELITMYEKNDRYGVSGEAASRKTLNDLKERLSKKGLNLSYSFDPRIHDRTIETESIQIILGRGLDIYYPPESSLPDDQQYRRTRKCRIIYLSK